MAAFGLVLALALAQGAASAQPENVANGSWRLTTTGEPFAGGTVQLSQTGATVAGTYGQNGKIDGSFKPGTLEVDGTWLDARGTGWLTIVFAADGGGFSGEWGYPGRRPVGSFTASRILPAPSLVRGRYYVTVSGSQEFPPARRMTLHQLGANVVGNLGPYTDVRGTIASDARTLLGTWRGPTGQGWMRLRFSEDGRSFEGDWGLPSDNTQPRGHIVGTTEENHVAPRAMRAAPSVSGTQVWVRGLWDTIASGQPFSIGRLTLQQRDQTVNGRYRGGHLHGTIPRGSAVLSGRWRDARGVGTFAFTFAPDGKTFQGTWALSAAQSGSMIGRRVIAASPALHQ